MMNHLLSNIQLCEREEYARAAKQHGLTFNSLHEGYAVLMEEAEEATEEVRNLDRAMATLWQATRNDDLPSAEQAADKIRQTAYLLAAEAVQTAAMAHKLLTSMAGNRVPVIPTKEEPSPRQRRAGRFKKNESPQIRL